MHSEKGKNHSIALISLVSFIFLVIFALLVISLALMMQQFLGVVTPTVWAIIFLVLIIIYPLFYLLARNILEKRTSN